MKFKMLKNSKFCRKQEKNKLYKAHRATFFISLVLLFTLFLLPIVSAEVFTFDNVVDYSHDDMEATIVNFFGLGGNIGTVRLTSHSTPTEVRNVIEGKDRAVMYYEFSNWNDIYVNGLGKVEFTDMRTGKKIDKEYYFAKAVYKNISINDYGKVCEDKIDNGTVKSICENEVVGVHKESKRTGWERLVKNNIPKEKTTIALITDVNRGDYIDGVWTIAGKKINKHATWTDSFNEGLLGYYTFDENAIDVTGNGNDCVGEGSPVHYSSGGIIDGYYNFTGANDFYCNGQDYRDALSGNMTISYWAKASNAHTGGLINQPLTETPSGNNVIWTQYEQVDRYESAWNTNVTTIAPEGAYDNRNVWQHFVLTYNGTTATLYQNGTVAYYSGVYQSLALTGALDQEYTGSPNMRIGIYLGTSITYWEGGIDEVALWNRSLSASEVSDLNNNMNALQYIATTPSDTSPNVTLNLPLNNSAFSVSSVNFNCSATDDYLIQNISLYIDGNLNYTVIDGVDNFTELNKTLTFVDGNYNWTCMAYDNSTATQNDTAGIRLFTIDGTDPVMNIVYPSVNNSNWTINTLDINFTRSDANLASCWYSNDTYSKNTTIASCGNITSVIWGQGNHNITIWVNDTAGHEVNDGISFSIDSINPNLKVISPSNNTKWSNSNLDVNYSVSDTNLDSCWYSNDTMLINNSLATCGANITTIIWAEGGHNVSIWANDTYGNVNKTTISFSIDTIPPVLNVIFPNETITFHKRNTNLSLNWSVSDTHLDSCWYNWNGVNTSVSCGTNYSFNTTTGTIKTLIFYANDTYGNNVNKSVSWDYRLFLNSETFDSSITEGVSTTFSANLLTNGSDITTSSLNYDSDYYLGTVSDHGNNNFTVSRTLFASSVSTKTNISFYWNITQASLSYLLNSKNQTVINFGVDNCTINSIILYNFTIVDEGKQNILNKTSNNTNAKVDLSINSFGGSLIVNFNKSYIKNNPFTICINSSLTSGEQFKINALVEYSADNYQTEFYNIQNETINSSTLSQNKTLRDLLTSDAQVFKLITKDSSFLVVKNALVEVYRKYIDEGVYKIVEIPRTDAKGETTSSLVLNNVIYKFVIKKFGETISTFENVKAICQTPTISECSIDFNAFSSGLTIPDYTSENNFNYTLDYNSTSKTIISQFAIPDGSVLNVTLMVIKEDALGTFACTDYLMSSSGTLSCQVPNSIGNATVLAKVYSDGVLKGQGQVKINQSPSDIYGGVVVFLAIFVIMTLIGVGISGNPIVTIFFLMIGVILLISLNLVSNNGFVGATATVLWLFIALILILIKGARRS